MVATIGGAAVVHHRQRDSGHGSRHGGRFKLDERENRRSENKMTEREPRETSSVLQPKTNSI